jgi:hypothetical protein
MVYIPLHLSSILLATPWLHLLLAPGDPLRLQQEAPKKKLPIPTIRTLLPSFSISCRKKKPSRDN